MPLRTYERSRRGAAFPRQANVENCPTMTLAIIGDELVRLRPLGLVDVEEQREDGVPGVSLRQQFVQARSFQGSGLPLFV